MSGRLWFITTQAYPCLYLTDFGVLLYRQVYVWQTLVYYYTVKFMSSRLWCITKQSSSCLTEFGVLLHSQIHIGQTLVYYYTVKFMFDRLWCLATQLSSYLIDVGVLLHCQLHVWQPFIYCYTVSPCLRDFSVLLYSQVNVWQILVHCCQGHADRLWCILTQQVHVTDVCVLLHSQARA